jgi:hypothetical protein
MNFDFLLTPEGQTHVAIATVIIIALALLFNLHPFKKRKQLTFSVGPSVETSYDWAIDTWKAGEYFTFVKSIVMASRNLTELESTMEMIEGFHNQIFSEPIGREQYNNYYTRLLESYCEKETELTTMRVVVCKN